MTDGNADQPGEKLRAPKAAGLVASQIRRQIVRKDLADGESLPAESVLLRKFGVSRPTLREALRVLEAEALITVRRGARGGARVNVPTEGTAARYTGLLLEYRQTTTADAFAAATAIEAPRAGSLADSHSADDIKRLHGALRRESEAASDPVRLLDAQNEFHRLVVHLAGNQTLSILSDMLREIIDTAARRFIDRGPDSTSAAHTGSRAHAHLVTLIEKGDRDGAERLWRKHITETGAYLTASGAAENVVDLLT